MLSPRDFVARWGKDGRLVRFRKGSVEKRELADEDKEFLETAGLPASAAPFLNFEAPKSGELPTVADAYDQPAEFRSYRVIGFDGAGNPIAVDEDRAGEVVCLDHEERFAPALINNTIRQLAESLLAFREAWRDAVGVSEDDDSDSQIPPAARKKLFQQLKKIDPAAMKPGCFWPDQVKISDAKAEYPANVLRDLRSPEASVRLKASNHLQGELRKGVTKQRKEQFGNKSATSPLIAALDDSDPKVVHNAVVALAQIASNYFKDDRAYPRILQLVASKHPMTRRWAICAAINLREEASLDDVLPLCRDRSQEAREMTLHFLFRWLMQKRTERSGAIRPENKARLQKAALHALNDSDASVRGAAADLLREVGDATALAGLAARLKKERNRDAKQNIMDAMDWLEGRL